MLGKHFWHKRCWRDTSFHICQLTIWRWGLFAVETLILHPKTKTSLRILYFVTVIISALVGLWLFFVPWMFQWYDYLPMQYENLIVGIDYTNYCFSLLLLGLSVMLILLGKRALDMNREVIYFYFFLTVVWMFRACLASFIEPWPLQPIPAAAIGQLVASDALAIMMVVVSVCFIKELRSK